MPISILATMKFIVRGKSVDFRNREGSSPSIPKSPKKGPFNSLTIYPMLVVPNSLCFSFILLFSIYKRIRAEFFLLSHTSRVVYRIHVQMNTFEQGISMWMIHNPYHCSYWNWQSLLFEYSRNAIPRPRLLRLNFVFFNWHRPKPSSKMKMMRR